MFRIFTTKEFDKDFSRLSAQEQIRVNKILNQLKEQGGDIGEPLSGLSFVKNRNLQ